jgi:hypothetical protein
MIKYPACVLRPARLVTQMTDLVVRALPEPVYPAMIPCHQLVATTRMGLNVHLTIGSGISNPHFWH